VLCLVTVVVERSDVATSDTPAPTPHPLLTPPLWDPDDHLDLENQNS